MILGYLETVLEGKFRPGHFQGVCRVVHRLLEIIQPDNLYLGQKDYQQCMVITRLVDMMASSKPVKVNVCPTLRETDGLAMSSRNVRLNPTERITATAIFRTLSKIKNDIRPGELDDLKNNAVQQLAGEGFRVDYVEIADASTLQSIASWSGEQKLVALVAAFMNDVRLIDNMIVT